METEKKAIVFTLGDEKYAIEVDDVRTIERLLPITRVPKTFTFVKGVINLRGVVTPVIDLRGRFGIEEIAYTEMTRIIVVDVDGLEVGFIVDSAYDVITLDEKAIETPPEVVGGIQAKYIRGIVKLKDERLLIILYLPEVLNKSEIIQLESVVKDS